MNYLFGAHMLDWLIVALVAALGLTLHLISDAITYWIGRR